MSKVLVTGCNGYIGAHTVKKLAEQGHTVYGLDQWRGWDFNHVEKYLDKLYYQDITRTTYISQSFDTIIHLAAKIDVEESTREPHSYYKTNFLGTLNLIKNLDYNNFVFGSTAAAFDMMSPYGRSKAAAEDVIKELLHDYTIFRFFNVAGSDGDYRQIGKATHLIRIAAETAAGKRNSITINGDDYDTPDGTCYRDYVHVEDLADSLIKAVDNISRTDYECISTGKVYSNLEVIETMQRVTGVDFKYDFGPRRAGDPAYLAAPSVSKYMTKKPKSLEEMCLSAYNMELLNV